VQSGLAGALIVASLAAPIDDSGMDAPAPGAAPAREAGATTTAKAGAAPAAKAGATTTAKSGAAPATEAGATTTAKSGGAPATKAGATTTAKAGAAPAAKAGATPAAVQSVRGRVVDETGAPVVGASIEAPAARRAAVSDAAGWFVLSLPVGAQSLRVMRLGYEGATVEIEIPASAPLPEPVLQLRTKPLRAAPVVVQAQRTPPPAPQPGRYRLEPEKMRQQIATFEDVMRNVQQLPGVSSASDLHGELFVRGTDAHANAILLDGIEIAFPYHILGLNSIFNPGLVESAEFYAGGAPVEFGDATGGILALRSRGATPSAEHGAIGISYLSGQLRAAAGGASLGFVASLRRSYQAELLRALGAPAGRLVPTFHDAFVRGRWRPANGHLVTVGLLHASDGMALPRPELNLQDLDFVSADGPDALERLRAFASAHDHLQLDNRFWLGTASWRAVLGSRAYLETTLGVAPQSFRFALEGDNHESVAIDARTTTLRQDLTWRSGRHRAKAGWLAYRDDTVRRVSAYAGILTLRESNSGINLLDLKNVTRSTRHAGATRQRSTCRTIGRGAGAGSWEAACAISTTAWRTSICCRHDWRSSGARVRA
jgi:hypothetical protein